MIPPDETRHRLVRLLQLAYSGQKAAALAYQGHSRFGARSRGEAMREVLPRCPRARGARGSGDASEGRKILFCHSEKRSGEESTPGISDGSRFLASLGMTGWKPTAESR